MSEERINERETLKKCEEAFPGFQSPQYNTEDLRSSLLKDSGLMHQAQTDLMAQFKIAQPESLTKLAAAASLCKVRDQQEKEYLSDAKIADSIASKIDESIAAAILKDGINAYANVLKLEGEPTWNRHHNVRAEPEWFAPNLTLRESRIRDAISKKPDIEVEVTSEDSQYIHSNEGRKPTYYLSARLKRTF